MLSFHAKPRASRPECYIEVQCAAPMAVGFVLINTSPAREHEVYDQLRGMDRVAEVHPLFGEYDLIAKIEAHDYNELGKIVVNQMRSIPGILNTKTLTGTKI